MKNAQTVLLLFLGIVSVFMTTSILLNLFGIREIEGNYVPFVVYANFVCGFLYLFALFTNKNRRPILLAIALILLVITMIALIIYINRGGIYESKTVKAMIFRVTITAALLTSSIYLSKNNQ